MQPLVVGKNVCYLPTTSNILIYDNDKRYMACRLEIIKASEEENACMQKQTLTTKLRIFFMFVLHLHTDEYTHARKVIILAKSEFSFHEANLN